MKMPSHSGIRSPEDILAPFLDQNGSSKKSQLVANNLVCGGLKAWSKVERISNRLHGQRCVCLCICYDMCERVNLVLISPLPWVFISPSCARSCSHALAHTLSLFSVFVLSRALCYFPCSCSRVLSGLCVCLSPTISLTHTFSFPPFLPTFFLSIFPLLRGLSIRFLVLPYSCSPTRSLSHTLSRALSLAFFSALPLSRSLLSRTRALWSTDQSCTYAYAPYPHAYTHSKIHARMHSKIHSRIRWTHVRARSNQYKNFFSRIRTPRTPRILHSTNKSCLTISDITAPHA